MTLLTLAGGLAAAVVLILRHGGKRHGVPDRGAGLRALRFGLLGLAVAIAASVFFAFGPLAPYVDADGARHAPFAENVIVFVLFLIPGLPKDAFTYIIGLTDMRCDTFVILSTLARTPGVLVTTYAASDIAKGDYLSAAIIFIVFAIIAGIGLIFRDKIMEGVSRGGTKG